MPLIHSGPRGAVGGGQISKRNWDHWDWFQRESEFRYVVVGQWKLTKHLSENVSGQFFEKAWLYAATAHS